MSGASRNERFVRAARRLLAFQLAAAAGAAALAGWALLEVRDLVDERDRLAARLAQVQRPAPVAEAPPATPVAVAEPAAAAPPASTSPDTEAETAGDGREDPPDPVGNTMTDPPPPPPPAAECRVADRPGLEPIVCAPPYRRFPGTEFCLDANRVRIYCPPGVPGAPTGRGPDTPPPPPPPPRDCRSVEGRAIVCAPPYRTTPVPGVCIDRNNRPLRCPRGVIPREPGRTGAAPPSTATPRPTTAVPTRPRQPAGTATTGGQSPPRSTAPAPTTRPTAAVPVGQRPATTGTTVPSRTVRPAPVRPVLPPPESNQDQPH